MSWLYGMLISVADFFSLPILVKTWFAPWKDDVQSARNISLGDQLKLWEENMVSRLVGFVIRTVVILISLLTIGVGAVFGLAILAIWVLGPLLMIALPIIGILR